MPRLRPILVLLPLTATVALAAPTATRLEVSADPRGAMRFDKGILSVR